MRAAIVVLLLAPVLCIGAENHFYKSDTAVSSQAEVIVSNSAKTTVEFSLAGIAVEQTMLGGRDFTRILPLESDFAEAGSMNIEGMPDLPVYSNMLIIPDRSGVRVNVVRADYRTYYDIEVAPTQPAMPESGGPEPAFVINERAYNTSQFFPGQLVQVGEPAVLRDFRFVNVIVQPIQYNPVTRELRVYTNIEYELLYEGFDSRNTIDRQDNNISEAFLPLYRMFFDNADQVLASYNPTKGRYLILCPNDTAVFADSVINKLILWKYRKGLNTIFTRASQIPGGPTVSNIKAYIQSLYNNPSTRPDYLCIMGDVGSGIPDHHYSIYTSDHGYTTLAGSDYLPDIFVSRMSASDLNTFRSVVHKAIKYESDPWVGDPSYWLRGLSVAGNIGASTPRLTVLWVRDLLLEHGFTRVDTAFEWSGISCPTCYDTISAALNRGLSIVAYRGWAGSSGWYNPHYYYDDLDNQTPSRRLGVMTSIVCGTGNYGVANCFGEQWIRGGVPDTAFQGGPCFFGSTDGNTHTRWNNPIMVGFYAGLFHQVGIYHWAQNMVAGKLRQFETFPHFQASGGTLEQYFNTYNSLGDPELEIRTKIPQTMSASYNSTIPVGTNYLSVHVTGTGGAPLEGAYVNLTDTYTDSDTIFVGGYTNANGDVTLNFRNGSIDTVFVTITARDYIPHRGYCRTIAATVSLNADSTIIDDDDVGGTNGNVDGQANPAEILGLNIRLRNFGSSTTATSVSGTLTSLDPRATVTSPTQSYPNISAGGTGLPTAPFIVSLANNIPHNERITLQMAITSAQGSWITQVVLDIKSIQADSIIITWPGNADGRLDPGETSNMVVSFKNMGGLAGENITGVLSSTDEYVTITDANGSFGNIGINARGDNSGNTFNISISSQAFDGRIIPFTVNFTANQAAMNPVLFSKTFNVSLGQVNTNDPCGPDEYGYYMYDNTDIGYAPAPTYNWIEINPSLGGPGTRLSFPNYDDASIKVALPFPIKYYGVDYFHMIISTNGFVSFDTFPYDVGNSYWANWFNWPIPDPGNARAQISPFWDDIKSTNSTNGVYSYYDDANGRLIIEWSNMTHSNTDSIETFQMIIYDACKRPTPTGDNEIIFQYNHIVNNDYDTGDDPETYSSVGIENWEETIGIQYEYDNEYHPGAAVLANGRAIKITTARFALPPPYEPEESHTPSSFSFNQSAGTDGHSNLIISNTGDCALAVSVSVDSVLWLRQNPSASPIPPKEIAAMSESEQLVSKDAPFDGVYNPPVVANQGGPDAFGYRWIDSNEPGGPTYNWRDITSIGQLLTFSNTDEGVLTDLPIGFPFTFYGNDYTTFNLCANGYLSFTSTAAVWQNTVIPNAAQPNAMIAPYWDDLNIVGSGAVYRYTNNVDTCIVSFINVPHYQQEGAFTFQVILLPPTKIVYQYLLSTGPDTIQATIGIEDQNGTTGLQIVYNAHYVVPPMAVEIYCPPPPPPPMATLSVDPPMIIVNPGQTDTIEVTAHAESTAFGQFNWQLHVVTNDPTGGTFNLPVSLNVPLAYILGTVKESDNVTPIAGVIVQTYDSNDTLRGTDTTDALGRYSFARNMGTYRQTFSKIGYRDTTINGIYVPPSDTTDVVLLMGRRTGHISGIVKETNNTTPIPGVVVRTYDWNNVLIETDTTNAQGRYFVISRPWGTYRETFSKTGYRDTTLVGINLPYDDSAHVTMLLQTGAGPSCDYVQGDINGDGNRIGGDVTFGVRFFKGIGPQPPDSCFLDSTGGYLYVSGDVNGNCEFRGSDITRLVAYFKGAATLSYCHFFPPPVLLGNDKPDPIVLPAIMNQEKEKIEIGDFPEKK